MNKIKKARIEYLKTKLFVQALEYARMKRLGMMFEAGTTVLVSQSQQVETADYLLQQLANTSERMLFEMSAIDGENAAMTLEEQKEYYGKHK